MFRDNIFKIVNLYFSTIVHLLNDILFLLFIQEFKDIGLLRT
jgi:hypothetical protein